MDARSEHEAELFVRYEARIVALEVALGGLEDDWKAYKRLVDKLRDDSMIAAALAREVVKARSFRLTKLHVAIAIVAVFVPPMLTAALSLLVLHLAHGH